MYYHHKTEMQPVDSVFASKLNQSHSTTFTGATGASISYELFLTLVGFSIFCGQQPCY